MPEAATPNPETFMGTARFALVRTLGSGGMGIVYEAQDKVRSSRVALKTLQCMNPTDLYRFKKEFRSLQSLVHPNLVTLYEFVSEQGHWFFTMELVEGEDFLTYVRGPSAHDDSLSEVFGIPSQPLAETKTVGLEERSELSCERPGDAFAKKSGETASAAADASRNVEAPARLASASERDIPEQLEPRPASARGTTVEGYPSTCDVERGPPQTASTVASQAEAGPLGPSAPFPPGVPSTLRAHDVPTTVLGGDSARSSKSGEASGDSAHPQQAGIISPATVAKPLSVGSTRTGGVVGPPCNLNRLRSVLEQIAEGLHYLHEAGMLHRDLKPSNVLVTPAGRVAILDFGLITEVEGKLPTVPSDHERAAGGAPSDRGSARAVALTDRGLVVGTIRYMAPEQADALPLTRAADWYSFGVMMYEAMVGLSPFSGTESEILQRKRRGELIPPEQRRPGIPGDLSSLCMKLLASDRAERPEYGEIMMALRQGSAAPSLPNHVARFVSEQPFVGRERELACLGRAYQQLQAGETLVVLLRGRSGSGKSCLIERFLDQDLEPERDLILRGRCFEQESVPFKAVDSLVDSLSRFLISRPAGLVSRLLPRDIGPLSLMFPVLKRVDSIAAKARSGALPPDPLELRRLALGAIRELFLHLGRIQPVVLWIDDLQWGDLDSALLLGELLRGPSPPRLLLLASYRSEYDGVNPCLRAFSEAGAFSSGGATVRRIEVGPLEPRDAERLAAALLGDSGVYEPVRTAAIARESGGNPYLITEIARHLQARSTIPEAAAAGSGGVSLQEMVWSRIQRLPAQGRRLLEVVAVAGQPLSQKCACLASSLDVDDQASLALLRSERLLRSSGPRIDDEVEVYHDQIRESLLDRLALETRFRHHRRLAEELEAAGGADPETLAVHFANGKEPSRAGHYYREAAVLANRALAFDRAASLFHRALELGAWPFPTEGRLRGELGDALANSRRGREAGHVYLDAAAGVPLAQSIELRRRAFQQLLTGGEHDLGIEELRRVFRVVGLRYSSTPARALAWTALGLARLRLRGLGFHERPASAINEDELLKLDVGWSAGMSLSVIDSARAAQILVDNLHRGLRAGELSRATRPLLGVASLFAVRGSGGLHRYNQLMEQAERWIAHSDDPNLLALHYLVRGLAAYAQGRWSEALTQNDRCAVLYRERCTGVAMSLDLAAYYSLRSLCWLGDFAELRQRRRALLKEAAERQNLFSLTNYRTKVMTLDVLADDDPALAAHEISEAMSQWSDRGFHAQHLYALLANLRVDLYRGQGALARRRIRQEWDAYRRSQLHRSCIARINIDQMTAASALASWPDHAHKASLAHEVSAAARRLERERIDYAAALAAMFRGRLASLCDERARSIGFYKRAVEQFRALEMTLHEVVTQFRLGELLQTEDGDSLARRAVGWLESRQIRNPSSMIRMILP
jgi:serine/threonine protein kinase